MSNPDDFATEILQMSPAVAVSGITLMGIPLNEWVYILTIIYTIVCILSVIKKHWIDPYFNNKNNNKKYEYRQEENRGDSGEDSAPHGRRDGV